MKREVSHVCMVRGWKLESRRTVLLHVVKTKVLISFAVTAKLISAFVFADAKRRFSHDAS